jgi:hypothetical protein
MGWILPKGKYKGVDVDDIAKTDRFYLQWVLDNWELTGEEMANIKNALDPSRELLKPAAGVKYVTEAEVLKSTEFLLRKIESIRITNTLSPDELAERSVKEMFRMLTGKDYVKPSIF